MLDDIDQIKRIADAHKKELGFVRRPSLLESISRSELLVAKLDSAVVGFVEYRHRKDGQTTLYNIAVVPKYTRHGVGQKLVRALVNESAGLGKTCVCLKCPQDLPSNKFYENLGFQLQQTEPGKYRQLNIWCWTHLE